MQENFDTLRYWITNSVWRYSPFNTHCLVEKSDTAISMSCFTDNNKYTIRVTDTYLGAACSSRKPRPGETWCRGHDLMDGTFDRDTWHLILGDIVSTELCQLSSEILRRNQDATIPTGR